MEQLKAQGQALLENAVQGISVWVPRLLIGLVVIILILVVAKLIEVILRSTLNRIKFDALLEKIGVSEILQKVGIKSATHLLSRLAYFLFLFMAAQSVAEVVGLKSVSAGITAFIAYLPNVFSAVVVLLAGMMAGQVAGTVVSNAAKESGIEFAPALGKVVSALIVFVTGIMAIGQLRIDTDIVRIVTVCSLAALSLAFGLSFGLGTREITRNIIAGYYARKVFRMGEEIDVGGERGRLKAITPTQTLLDRDGQTVALSNSAFLDKVVRQ